MDANKKQKKIYESLALATAKINHLSELLTQINIQVDKCQAIIDEATKKMEELKEKPQ